MKNLLACLCFCAVGIYYSNGFVQHMREIQNNCAMDGGFCINTIPPPPVRPKGRGRGRGKGRGQGRRRGTMTRSGTRPARPGPPGPPGKPIPPGLPVPPLPPGLPGRKPTPEQAAAAANLRPSGTAGGSIPARPWQQPPGQQQQLNPQQQQTPWLWGNLFGGGMNDYLGMMMFTRKKRQAPAEPMEPGEGPIRIRRGQNMFTFLNQHCLKTQFDFGCRSTGGMCCIPFP